MNCPFCQLPVTGSVDKMGWTIYFCDAPECMLDDMSRFEETRCNTEEPNVVSRQFIFNDNLCVNISYLNDCTVISKMIAYFLVDSFQVPRALEIDMDNAYNSLPKIRTLVTFS